MGWFMIYDPAIYNLKTYDRYARDLFQDRFYKWLERPQVAGGETAPIPVGSLPGSRNPGRMLGEYLERVGRLG